jgi:hypothetical protein
VRVSSGAGCLKADGGAAYTIRREAFCNPFPPSRLPFRFPLRQPLFPAALPVVKGASLGGDGDRSFPAVSGRCYGSSACIMAAARQLMSGPASLLRWL